MDVTNVENWIVHLKDENGQHIIEPTVARNIEVSIETNYHEVSTIDGQIYQIQGPRTGYLSMQFDHSAFQGLEWFWHNILDYPQVDIQINPPNQDANNGSTRCVLSSMNFETSFNEWESVVNLTWIFLGNLNQPNIVKQKIVEDKLDWRQFGF